MDEKIDESVLRWFGHVESITKRVYVGKRAGTLSAGRPRKTWTDTTKDCLKKISLDVREARRMVHDRSVWWGFGRGNVWVLPEGLTIDLTRS